MSLRSIEEEWNNFANHMFVRTEIKPGDIQYEECKKVFFAGYYTCIVHNMQLGEPDVSEARGVLFLEARRKEAERVLKVHVRRGTQS